MYVMVETGHSERNFEHCQQLLGCAALQTLVDLVHQFWRQARSTPLECMLSLLDEEYSSRVPSLKSRVKTTTMRQSDCNKLRYFPLNYG